MSMNTIKKYNVHIRRTEWGTIEIEAINEEHAKEKAYEACLKGQTIWGVETIDTVKVEELKLNK